MAESNYAARLWLDDPIYAKAKVIHLVRDAILCIRSRWLGRPILRRLPQPEAIVRTVEEYLGENEPLEAHADVRVRLEDCPEAMLNAVGYTGEPIDVPALNSHWAAAKHRYPFELTWEHIPGGSTRDRLVAMAERYGYAGTRPGPSV